MESKDRWNSEHYDQLNIRLPKGARAELQLIARKRGMSVAGYIKHLVVRDLNEDEDEITEIIRGGGLIRYWKAEKSREADGWHV